MLSLEPPSSFSLLCRYVGCCKNLATRARSVKKKKNALVGFFGPLPLLPLCTCFLLSPIYRPLCDNEIIPKKRIFFRAEVTKEQ